MYWYLPAIYKNIPFLFLFDRNLSDRLDRKTPGIVTRTEILNVEDLLLI